MKSLNKHIDGDKFTEFLQKKLGKDKTKSHYINKNLKYIKTKNNSNIKHLQSCIASQKR